MKKLLLILVIAVVFFNRVNAQSVSACPLDMSDIAALPIFYSAPSHNTLWVAMFGFDLSSLTNNKQIARTTDGGATWTITSIPETMDRGGSCIYATDDNTAYVGLSDIHNVDGGAIWKTTDGGDTWTQQTTTQFSGGYLEYIAFFTPDSGVAFGDPKNGYFEIYTTSDGGSNWIQVPEANIPPIVAGELGNGGNPYGLAGDRVWFATSKGRIIYSYDRGATWSASTVNSSYGYMGVTMNDTIHGAAWKVQGPISKAFITNDGGQTWVGQNLSPSHTIDFMCAVKDVPGTFVFKSGAIYATTDNFQTNYLISNEYPMNGNTVLMYDATIGWTQTSVFESDSAIIKIEDVATGVGSVENTSAISSFSVFPNPVTANAALVSFTLDKDAEVTLALSALSGKIIREQTRSASKGNNAVIFDFSGIAQGMYLLNLQSGKRQASVKVLVQ